MRKDFVLQFGEILLMCFVPIGMLQTAGMGSRWEYEMVSKTSVLLSVLAGIVVISAAIALLWKVRGWRSGAWIHSCLQTIAVCYLAFWISVYGAAKILGTQFQAPQSVLDTPLGELNGFWLTWAYYGFSRPMVLILGWTQITGCLLILFRASRLLGLLILLPVMVNIDLIDHFYQISPLASFNALHYTLFLIVLLLIDWPILRSALLSYRDKARIKSRWAPLGVVKVALVGLAFLQIAVFKGSLTPRTSINGVWRVDSAVGVSAHWSKLYFEWRYGCIFKVDPNQFTDQDLQGNYTVDKKASLLHIGFPQAMGPKGKQRVSDSMLLHYYFKTDSAVELRGTYREREISLLLKRLR